MIGELDSTTGCTDQHYGHLAFGLDADYFRDEEPMLAMTTVLHRFAPLLLT